MGAGGGKVFIVGAGPGDAELITLKGMRLLKEADLVVYAGSLVNEELLSFCRPDCEKVNSHGKRLTEIVELMADAAAQGRLVVRLASGDPSLYGSLKEMREELEARGVEVEVVPGVSSLFAGAAALKEEFTVPGGPQSLVVTRLPGRTPVSPSEALERFVATGASVAVFLSADRVEEIKERALRAGAPPDTPVAVVYKASWKQQRVWESTLGELRQPEGVKGSAIVYILPGRRLRGKRSHLYGAGKACDGVTFRERFYLIPVSGNCPVVGAIAEAFPGAVLLDEGPLRERFKRAWELGGPLVLVGPVGVAVRLAAPFVKDKRSDPPVVAVDIAGSFAVAVLGGHYGANRLVREIARAIGAVPVITTGTEVLGVPSLEEILEERGLVILGGSTKAFNSNAVRGKTIYSVGMGWRKGVGEGELKRAVDELSRLLPLEEVSVFAVPLFKAQEARALLGIIPQDAALVGVPEEVMNAFPGPSPSRAVDKLGIAGAAEPCALCVLPGGRIRVKKRVVGPVTFAVGEAHLG